jgi:tetratricopeptide (TPR) repeat protein
MEKSDLRRRNRPCCGQSKSKTSGQISKGKLCRDITEKLDNRNGSVGVTKSPKEEEEEISSVHYLSLTLPYITSGGDHSFQRGNNRSEKNELDDNPPSIITASDTGSEEMISATSGQTALTKDRVQETIRCFANIDWHLKRANTMPHIGQSTKDTPVNVDFVMESTKEEISFFAKSKIQAGKLDEAVDIFDSVLDYYRPRSGKNNLFVALALHNLCVINIWNGNFERALIYGQEALRVRRELYGSNHISIVSSLCELGVIYYAKEEFNRSLSSFREALQLKYKAMGGDNIDVSSILNNIGCVHYSLGKLVTSEATFQEALNLQKRCLGSVKSEHADRALLDMSINLCNMALVAEKMSKLDDAQSLLEEGLMVQQSVLADTHRIVLGTKSLLSCLQNDGKLEDCRLNIDISMPYRLEKKPEQKRKRTYEKRRVHLNCTKNIDMVSLGPVPNGMKTIHKVSLPFNNECLANVLLAEGKKKNESWVDLDSPYQERNHYDTNLYQLCEKASKLIQVCQLSSIYYISSFMTKLNDVSFSYNI